MPEPKEPSALETKLKNMDAMSKKFGPGGLKQYAVTDVALLLANKSLILRDTPRGRELDEEQKEANRLLELEIRELSGVMDSHFATLTALQRFTYGGEQKPVAKHPERERDR